MLLMEYLRSLLPFLTTDKTKIHLARYNGQDAPLDKYIAGEFDDWQCWQANKNFQCQYVVSLVQAHHPQRWLYVGTFEVLGLEDKRPRGVTWEKDFYRYNLKRLDQGDEYAGRMYVHSDYTKRQSFLKAETLKNDLKIQEISPIPLSFGEFPGYKNVVLTREQLELIILRNLHSWRTALETVKGIYLITDRTTGKLYVGKASGSQGIWERWKFYSRSVHGNNVALVKELADASPERLLSLSFSILEVMDINATESEVICRESHWKNILLSREFGHNRN